MASRDLILKIDRSEVSVTEFIEALSAQLALVREVGVSMGIPADAVRWVIEDLRGGSAYVVARAHLRSPKVTYTKVSKALAQAGKGVRGLERSARRPAHFSDEALRQAKRLTDIVNSSTTGAAQVGFGAIDVPASRRVSANVDEIMAGRFKSIGSVEGMLVAVTADNGYRFAVRDRARNRKVQCVFPAEMMKKVLAAFDQRVIVRGVIWSRKDGLPNRIEAKTIEVIPDDSRLTSVAAARGILKPWRPVHG